MYPLWNSKTNRNRPIGFGYLEIETIHAPFTWINSYHSQQDVLPCNKHKF